MVFFKKDSKESIRKEYWPAQAKKYWLKHELNTQAMLALIFNRQGDTKMAKLILASLEERALQSEEMGKYWKDNAAGYRWTNFPVETQARLIEAYSEVLDDTKAIEEMQIWLLKQKQTQHWPSTTSTADACYALLLGGRNMLASTKIVAVKVGNEMVKPLKTEAGTGYFRKNWEAKEINTTQGNINVQKQDEGIAWGAVYFQYFEKLDKIT